MTASTKLAAAGAALVAVTTLAATRLLGAHAGHSERGVLVSGYLLAKDPALGFLDAPLDRLGGQTLVVRVKDSDGILLTPTAVPARHGVAQPAPVLGNFAEVGARLHARGRHVVAYLVMFKDRAFGQAHPSETIQRRDGTSFADAYGVFIDPGSARYQAYVLELIDELAGLPFVDEVMLDYVRYPEYDPSHTKFSYPYTLSKADRIGVIREFVQSAAGTVHRRGKRISVAVFPPSRDDYLGLDLGQDLALLAGSVDVLSPMIYPDQFEHGATDEEWHRFFETSYDRAVRFAHQGGATLRPWIQGFAFAQRDGKRVSVPLPDARMKWQLDYLGERRVPFLIYNSRSEYRLP